MTMQAVYSIFNSFHCDIKRRRHSFLLLMLFVFALSVCTKANEQTESSIVENVQLVNDQTKLQQLQVEHSKLILNGIILGAFVSVLMVALSVKYYKFRIKTNQLLESKENEIAQKNDSLEKLLGEKDWMLKEIHHRVRNNLQIITSLLNSQASHLSDNTALSAIKESQHQVQAIAFIHQRLYQSEQVARVDIAPYLNDLIVYLRDAYKVVQTVRFHVSVEPMTLNISLAVPLGLIVNEAVTNALKYAFPEGRPGTISLRLNCRANATYELIINDDGVGLPSGFDPSRSNSLGMTLMYGLSKQIDAGLKIINGQGVSVHLLFDDEKFNSDRGATDRQLHFSALLPVFKLEGVAIEKCRNILK